MTHEKKNIYFRYDILKYQEIKQVCYSYVQNGFTSEIGNKIA